jgi:hypothetical protein
MRIAISGTACQGKSTFIEDMNTAWPSYIIPEKSYRDILPEDHSKKTSEDTQWEILDFMLENLQEYRKGDMVIFDRCPLDNIVYSIWANGKGNISDEFISKCIPLIYESMKMLDVIFFIPITKHAEVELEENGTRDADEEYVTEIDNIFKTMYQQWLQPDSPFFPKDDRPAIIEIFGNRQQRIQMASLYIDEDGSAMGEQGIINPTELAAYEKAFGLTK